MKDRVASVGEYCNALRMWAGIMRDRGDLGMAVSKVDLAIRKSCLLKRMIYMGEELRTRKCPVHEGEWSGCYPYPCPAGCDTCGCACGWLPNDAPSWEAWGWTFWLNHALDENSCLPGKPPAKFYANGMVTK